MIKPEINRLELRLSEAAEQYNKDTRASFIEAGKSSTDYADLWQRLVDGSGKVEALVCFNSREVPAVVEVADTGHLRIVAANTVIHASSDTSAFRRGVFIDDCTALNLVYRLGC